MKIASLTIILLIVVLASFGGVYFFPWNRIQWGTVTTAPSRTITVSGQSTSQERSQIARFSAGVSSVKDNKDEAVTEVNTKTKAIIDSVKEFGIDEDDIKTQNLSINQNEESYYDSGEQRYKSRPGQWRVNNSIEIVLRNVNQADALATLLTKSGATNVYGPNFSVDDTQKVEDSLLESAIEDAHKKAEIIAKSSEGKVGKVMTVIEGSSFGGGPIVAFSERGGGGGVPLEPGTSTISKSVTVTFALE